MKFIFPLLFLVATSLHAQVHCTQADHELCEHYLKMLNKPELVEMPIGDLAVYVGKRFIGTPYEAKTLEKGNEEQLVIYLDGLDCTTFLENVVVFSRLVKRDSLTFEEFQNELRQLRYRDGEMESYASRLHYFTEWIHNNTQKGIVRDVTAEVGGIPYPKQINFMSTHRSAYAQLSNDGYYAEIQQVEAALNQQDRCYIPKDSLRIHEENIQGGDLIAITTSIDGLDVSHTGIAVWKNGRLHLMHASTGSNEVEISKLPLAEYLAGNRRQTGIIVSRLEELQD